MQHVQDGDTESGRRAQCLNRTRPSFGASRQILVRTSCASGGASQSVASMGLLDAGRSTQSTIDLSQTLRCSAVSSSRHERPLLTIGNSMHGLELSRCAKHQLPLHVQGGPSRSRSSERTPAQTLQCRPSGYCQLPSTSFRGVRLARSRTSKHTEPPRMAPKIYHLHPLVAGKLSEWPLHFARCRAMGFEQCVLRRHSCLAPAATSSSPPITRRCIRRWAGQVQPMTASHSIAQQAAEHGLRIWLDLSIDQVAIDAVIRRREDDWFATGGCGAPPSPGGHRIGWMSPMRGCSRPRSPRRWPGGGWIGSRAWCRRVSAGFRCLDPDRAPRAALATDHRHV